MNAELSSHLLVLCAASTDPWAVGWQNTGRVRGGGEQQAVPGRRACGQRLGMCDVQTILMLGPAGTGNQTQATCVAGSSASRSAIHYDCVIDHLFKTNFLWT
jgi:hypothetical protein